MFNKCSLFVPGLSNVRVKVIKKVVLEKSPAGISLHYLSVGEKREGP
jgi:hypothetical protein